MTDIAPVGGGLGVGGVPRIRSSAVHERQDHSEERGAPIARPSDRVELSERAMYLSKFADLPIRHDLVERTRRSIREGSYDTPERLEAAIALLLHELDLHA